VHGNAEPPPFTLAALPGVDECDRPHDTRRLVDAEGAGETPSLIARLRPCNTGNGEQRRDDEQ
jgi:hypothetical protein